MQILTQLTQPLMPLMPLIGPGTNTHGHSSCTRALWFVSSTHLAGCSRKVCARQELGKDVYEDGAGTS